MDALTAARPTERDIDVVLVTGAGASREFGAGGIKLPLMGDWATALVTKLGRHPAYLEASGLRAGLSGYEFEVQLGRFLQQVRAFPLIGDLLTPSVQFQPSQPPLTDTVLKQWHQQADFHLQEILNLIHESLYELFGVDAIDRQGAISAYGTLLQTLGVDSAKSLVYATTNYDPIGELALTGNGRLVDWGEPPTPAGAGERRVDVTRLLAGIHRYVPVLHVHGRIGWYRRPGATSHVYATDVSGHQKGLGIPIVMLPDPSKVYDEEEVINLLWQQFAEALARAKRVLVLGHSLNDQAIVRVLEENIDPPHRLAVTVLADPNNHNVPDQSSEPVQQVLREKFGKAAVIPFRFGPGMQSSGALQTWITNTLAFS